MTSVGTLTIAGQVTGAPDGTKSLNLAFGPITGASGETVEWTFGFSGLNPFPVPTGATWAVILPPPGNAVQFGLMYTGIGSPGFPIDMTRPTVIPLSSANTVVNSGVTTLQFWTPSAPASLDIWFL